MLSERSPLQKATHTWFHLYQMSSISKKFIKKSISVVAWVRWDGRGNDSHWVWGYLWGRWWKFSKINCGDGCRMVELYTLKGVNLPVCQLYLNEDVKSWLSCVCSWFTIIHNINSWVTWVAQSVRSPTFDFSSGGGPQGLKLEPQVRLHAAVGTCLRSSLLISLCPSPPVFSPLSKIKIN